MYHLRSLSKFTWCLNLPDFTLIRSNRVYFFIRQNYAEVAYKQTYGPFQIVVIFWLWVRMTV